MSEAPRILVIRRRAVGDLVVSMAVPAALRRRWPKAQIDLLADRGPHAAAEGSPHVDEVVVYDRRAHKKAPWWRRPRMAWRWLRGLRARRYDLVLDLMGTPQTAIWTWFTGAPTRVGRRRRWRSWAYTLPLEPPGEVRFAGEVFLDWVRGLGLEAGPWEPVPLRLEPGQLEAASAAAQQLVPGRGPLVALVPSASWPAKAWPLEHFAQIARELAAGGARVLVAWGPGEEARRDSILRLAGDAAVAMPPLGLRELAAWLAACELVVCTDSGPKHLAVAMGTPTLTLFGSTDPRGWQPPGSRHEYLVEEGLPCRPCDRTTCHVPGHPCLDGMQPSRVLVAARAMLEREDA